MAEIKMQLLKEIELHRKEIVLKNKEIEKLIVEIIHLSSKSFISDLEQDVAQRWNASAKETKELFRCS